MSMMIENLGVDIEHKTLLADINLTLKPDQLTILIGPNGAGKSTLLNACAGDITPSQGTITLNNKPLEHYSQKELSLHRAVMTQSYHMTFSFTVREIITMGCYVYEDQISIQDKQEIIQAVMAFMDITKLADRSFHQLSGGEQQRTQLARVLAQLWHPYVQEQPRYLFLDEPTSSLDIFHQYQTLKLAKQLTKRHIGVLAVVHDLSLAASFADSVVLLSQGKKLAEGAAEDVLQKDYLRAPYNISGYHFQQSEHCFPSVLLEK